MINLKLRQIVWFVALIFVATLMVACQTETTPEAESESEANNLVIYSGRKDSLVQPIIDQFAAETGINVEVRYGGTAEMAGVLLEEGENSPADVFYAQDPGGLGAVSAAGLLAPLPDATFDLVPSRFAPADKTWVGISGRARVVVYHTGAIPDAAELPTDIFDFVDEEWNGRIGWAPSNGSFQAMVTAMRSTWGEEKTREWLTGIRRNNPVVYSGNTPIVAGVAANEVDVGFVNHYYLYRFLAEEGDSFSARNQFLADGGPGSLIMVSGAGILNTAPNGENAQRFIDYLLSNSAQQYFADQTYEYPVVDDINTFDGLPALAQLDAAALNISLEDLADLEGTQDLLLELGIIE